MEMLTARTDPRVRLDISAIADMIGSVTDLVLAAKALADPTRVRIVAALRRGELCVCELSDALQVTQSTLSTHLQVIRDASLVRTRREGKWVYYALRSDKKQLIKQLFGFFESQLKSDARIGADAQRLAERLAQREDGACCRGYVAPRRKRTARQCSL
jgi:ArsR family transcriptional regulator